MPDGKTITLTFIVDLALYAQGMKTMLSMTQIAGQQIKPLLNLEMKAPDFSPIDKALKGLTNDVQRYVAEQSASTETTDRHSTALAANAKITDKVTAATAGHVEGMRGVRRESIHMFGALAFLSQNLLQLTASTSGESKELQKLNQGLSQGISAGFGLASILSVLAIVTGGTAVAIGAIATVGVTLLSFLDDSKSKAERLQKAMDGFSNTLKGASLQSLQEYRQNLLALELDTKKNLKAAREYQEQLSGGLVKGDPTKSYRENLKNAGKTVDQLKEALSSRTKELEQLDAELATKQKTYAEWRDLIRNLEIASIVNSYNRQRAEAQKWYEDQFNLLIRAAQTTKAGHDILVALNAQLAQKLNDIDKAKQQNRIAHLNETHDKLRAAEESAFEDSLAIIRKNGIARGIQQDEIDQDVIAARIVRLKKQLADELQYTDQKDAARIAKEADLLRQIDDLEVQGAQAEIQVERQKDQDLQRLREMATETEMLKIRMRGINQAKSEEQINIEIIAAKEKRVEVELQILNDQEAKGKQLDRKQIERKRQLENELTQLQLDGFEARKQLWSEEMGVIDQGYRDLFKSITQQRVQTSQTIIESNRVETELFTIEIEKRKKDLQIQYEQGLIDRREYNLKMQQLDLEVAKKQQDNLDFQKKLDDERLGSWASMWNAMERAAMQAMENVTAKMIETYAINPTQEGAAHTVEKLALTGVGFLLGGPIGGLIGGGVAKLFGLAGGARVTKPTLAMVGEAGTEIVAPEKDFIGVFRDDLRPQLMDVFSGSISRDILQPQIKQSVLRAPGEVLRTNLRQAAVEAVKARLELSGQSATEKASQEIHVHIDTVIGTDDYVENNLKPAVEKLMRKLGADSVTQVFVNHSKSVTKAQ